MMKKLPKLKMEMFFIITNNSNNGNCVEQTLSLKSAIALALENNCDVCIRGPLLIFVHVLTKNGGKWSMTGQCVTGEGKRQAEMTASGGAVWVTTENQHCN